jgi:integrase
MTVKSVWVEKHIRRQPSGRFEVRVMLGGTVMTGTRATLAGARTLLRRWEIDYEKGTLHRPRSETVEAYLLRWLQLPRSERTRRKYTSHATHNLIPALGKKRLDRLTASEVQTTMNAAAARLAPATVHAIAAVLRIALTDAEREGLVQRNVARLVRLPPLNRREREALTPGEVRSLLLAVRGDRYEVLYHLFLSLGLRHSEALGLRWRDIDLDTGEVRLREQLGRVGGRWVLAPLKGRKSRRVVLARAALDQIRQHRLRQQMERERVADETGWGLVFTTPKGVPVWDSLIREQFYAHLDRAGVRRIHIHDLRHTAASLLANLDVTMHEVQGILGHTHDTMTARYVHHFPGEEGRAAAAMDALYTRLFDDDLRED